MAFLGAHSKPTVQAASKQSAACSIVMKVASNGCKTRCFSGLARLLKQFQARKVIGEIRTTIFRRHFFLLLLLLLL
jgi:hypothetical protein